MKQHSVVVAWFFDDLICRGFGFVDEVRIEDIKLQDGVSMCYGHKRKTTHLVSLYNFRRGVIGAAYSQHLAELSWKNVAYS